MTEGNMTWTSATGEFGFVSPDDGSRSVFVRLSSGTQSRCASPLEEEVAALEQRGEGADAHALASRVEVRTRYQLGHWAPGYEIAQIVDSGYHVRRPGSLEVVPEIVVPTDVRRAGDEG
jgi:cold shock CspA family protein